MRFQPVKCNMMQLTRMQIKPINAVYSSEEQSSKMWIILNTLSVTFSKDLKWNTLVSNVRTKQTEHLVFKDITYCHVPKMLRKGIKQAGMTNSGVC